jgi:polysaccharide export outer membrane protein
MAMMERVSISMHNPKASNRRTIAAAVATSIAAVAFLAFAPQPAALAQASTSMTNGSSATGTPTRPVPGANTQNPLVTVPEDFANLQLAPGFLLNVEVYGEPDLSEHVRVDSTGNISLPFLKSLHVGGGTIAQAQETIQQKFRDQGILKNPQVNIDVEQFPTTSATVIGEVQYPGRVELLAPHSLLDVIGLAGGETTLAGNEIELKRAGASAKDATTYHYSRGSSGDNVRSVMVSPGDTVIVKRAGVVYVLGAVNRPGGYAMQENGELNVAQAISLAQGMAMQAKTGALRVVKHGADGQLVDVPVSYNRMMDGKDVPMNLAAGDIVYVPVSKVKTFFTSTTGLIGQTAAATIYVH